MASLVQVLAFIGLFATVSCTKCYDDLGCFDTSLDCHVRDPNTPEEIGTSFKLYTSQNTKIGDVLDRTNYDTITSSSFRASRDTKLIVHGWTDSMSGNSWIAMKDTLLDNNDVNVVMVDWSKGADKLYLKSVANTRVVGREIAKLIEALNDATGASFDSMHIIGHSLGAHIGGYAGEACEGYTGEKVGRVTGLDPAGPEFRGNLENACRLDKTDAIFVDAMHTDGGGAGLMDELGHQDFYPNNGRHMPGCSLVSVSCDHSRAVDYFIQSIPTSCSFSSTRTAATWDDLDSGRWTSCNSWNCPEMGYKADLSKGTGAFYLETNKEKPYCQG